VTATSRAQTASRSTAAAGPRRHGVVRAEQEPVHCVVRASTVTEPDADHRVLLWLDYLSLASGGSGRIPLLSIACRRLVHGEAEPESGR